MNINTCCCKSLVWERVIFLSGCAEELLFGWIDDLRLMRRSRRVSRENSNSTLNIYLISLFTSSLATIPWQLFNLNGEKEMHGKMNRKEKIMRTQNTKLKFLQLKFLSWFYKQTIYSYFFYWADITWKLLWQKYITLHFAHFVTVSK